MGGAPHTIFLEGHSLNNAKLIRALVVAVLALIAIGAVLQSRRNAPPVSDELDQYLGALEALAPRITAIEVQTGATVLRVERSGTGWVLASREGFAAGDEPIQELVRGLIALETTQKMTAKPERHHELGVAWPDETNVARRIRVFVDGSPDATTDLIVGTAVQSPTGVYLRKHGENQAFRAKGRLAALADVGGWIKGPVVDMQSKDIQQVEVNGLTLTQRDSNWTFVQPATAEPDPVRDALKSTIPYLLSGFNPEDVRVARADDDAHPKQVTALFHLDADHAVEARIWKEEDGIWVRLALGECSPTPHESLDKYSALWQGWVFRLPSWRAGQFEPLFAPPVIVPEGIPER